MNAAVAAAWAAAACCGLLLLPTSCWMLAFTLSSVAWSWVGQRRGLVLRADQVVPGGGGLDCCCWSAVWVACSWAWAVCRWSMVVVTLPVAMEEYSERMPLVLGFDENIWVTWLVVPLSGSR